MAGIEDDDEEEEEEEVARGRAGGERVRDNDNLGSNDYVNVTGPEGENEEEEEEVRRPSLGTGPGSMEGQNLESKQGASKQAMRQGLQREDEAVPRSSKANGTPKKEEVLMESPVQIHNEPESILQPSEEDDDEDLRIPGSFDLSGPPQTRGPGETWGEMFRRLSMK